MNSFPVPSSPIPEKFITVKDWRELPEDFNRKSSIGWTINKDSGGSWYVDFIEVRLYKGTCEEARGTAIGPIEIEKWCETHGRWTQATELSSRHRYYLPNFVAAVVAVAASEAVESFKLKARRKIQSCLEDFGFNSY